VRIHTTKVEIDDKRRYKSEALAMGAFQSRKRERRGLFRAGSVSDGGFFFPYRR